MNLLGITSKFSPLITDCFLTEYKNRQSKRLNRLSQKANVMYIQSIKSLNVQVRNFAIFILLFIYAL